MGWPSRRLSRLPCDRACAGAASGATADSSAGAPLPANSAAIESVVLGHDATAERPEVVMPIADLAPAPRGSSVETTSPSATLTSAARGKTNLTLPVVLGGVGICVALLVAILVAVIRMGGNSSQLASVEPPAKSNFAARPNSTATHTAEMDRVAHASTRRKKPTATSSVTPAPTSPVNTLSDSVAPSEASDASEDESESHSTTKKSDTPGGSPKRRSTKSTKTSSTKTASTKTSSRSRSDESAESDPAPDSASSDNKDAKTDTTTSGPSKHNDHTGQHESSDVHTLLPGATREIIDRVGDGIVLVTTFDETGQARSTGSGFVIDAAGHVLTNHHVIRSAASATAQFRDGRECPISGYLLADDEHDLAVLQMSNPPKPLTVLPLAHGAEPQQADDVVTIGHPKGYNFTVSTGIISAIRSYEELPADIREGAGMAGDGRWIQITAPITHGNSGGPLLNAKGEVIGVNTWGMPQEGNLAFAGHISMIDQSLSKQARKAKPLPVPGARPPLDDLVAAVLRGFDEEVAKYAKKIEKAESEVERGRLAANSPIVTYMQKLIDLADEHRTEKVAIAALDRAYRLSLLDPSHTLAMLKTVEERLLADYLQDEKLGDVALEMMKGEPGTTFDFLTRLSNDSPHREVKAFATLALAVQQMDFLSTGNKTDEARALTLLKKLNSQYADVPVGDSTIGDIVEPMLFEVEHLTVGKKSQDIKGKDVDGHSLKLTDFRGKVVVVDFFSDRSEIASILYKHNNTFLRMYQREPFQFLGISVDPIDIARTAVNLKKVTWPCIWDGPQGTITTHWNVSELPHNFVIDAKGVIRYRDLWGEDLMRTIEVLLTEMNPRRTPHQLPSEMQAPPPKKASSRSRTNRLNPSTRGRAVQ